MELLILFWSATICKYPNLSHIQVHINILLTIFSFFALILYWSMIGKEILYKYLGFLKGTFTKGMFYVL